MYKGCQKLACNNCYESKEGGRTHESNEKNSHIYIVGMSDGAMLWNADICSRWTNCIQ